MMLPYSFVGCQQIYRFTDIDRKPIIKINYNYFQHFSAFFRLTKQLLIGEALDLDAIRILFVDWKWLNILILKEM
jgi:hypothetical protein